MKIIVYIFLISIAFHCCKKENLYGEIWVGRKTIGVPINGFAIISPLDAKGAFKLKRDSLISKGFLEYEHNMAVSTARHSFGLVQRSDTLYLSTESENVNGDIIIDSINALQVTIRSKYSNVSHVFHKTDSFSQKKKRDQLHKLLTNNKYQLKGEEKRYEFFENGTFICDKLNCGFEKHRMWNLDTFENELFLVSTGKTGMFLQIKEITEDSIDAVSFGSEIKEISLVREKENKQFDENLIYGKWVLDETNTSVNKYKYLQLDQKQITYGSDQISRTYDWHFNIDKNIIVIPWFFSVRQFNILNLNENELELEISSDWDFRDNENHIINLKYSKQE